MRYPSRPRSRRSATKPSAWSGSWSSALEVVEHAAGRREGVEDTGLESHGDGVGADHDSRGPALDLVGLPVLDAQRRGTVPPEIGAVRPLIADGNAEPRYLPGAWSVPAWSAIASQEAQPTPWLTQHEMLPSARPL